jgi:hypothetical protein
MAVMAVCAALALPASAALRSWLNLAPSPLGDARTAAHGSQGGLTQLWFSVTLPPGVHDALTVTFWTRLKPQDPARQQSFVSTMAFWCPDAIQRSNPDLLAGVGGYGAGGTNLTAAGGSVTVASFPFAAYTGHPSMATRWPKGVYTIAGAATNAITVSLGGEDVTVGPGAFNRNAVPGPSDSVVITGADVAEVGISRTPCHRYYQEIDGVADVESAGFFTDDSRITNELVMVTYRWKSETTAQIYQSNIGRLAAFNELSQTRTNAPCAGFSSLGDYRVGMLGPIVACPYEWEVFDARMFTRWLTDDELARVHRNGVQEIGRRGIPQWR